MHPFIFTITVVVQQLVEIFIHMPRQHKMPDIDKLPLAHSIIKLLIIMYLMLNQIGT